MDGEALGMQRWLGPILVGAGAMVFAVGMVGSFVGGDGTSATTTSTTVIALASSTTSEPSTTTSSAATTTQPTSTTTSTTASAPAATTTSTVQDETVDEFLQAFSSALAAGDRDFVFGRLHPVVIDGWGEDLCSAWVDREIMVLRDYTFLALVDGPLARVVNTPSGRATVPDYYTATVRFAFQGETFTSDSGFALVGTEMHWLGQCR
jgi:hypothetical protein